MTSLLEAEMYHKSVANVLHGYKAFEFGDSLGFVTKNPSEENFSVLLFFLLSKKSKSFVE